MRGRRVGWRLLILLWIWALLVFTVVDLFRDVPQFDRVRPRAPLYHAMRAVAHDIVGEPWPGTPAAGPLATPPRVEAPSGGDAALVLERLRDEPVAAWGAMLIEIRGRVPPEHLGAYGAAAAAAAAEAPAGEADALVLAALEAQAQALLLPSPDWRSARTTVERLAFVPGYPARFADALSTLRGAIPRGLGSQAPPDSLGEAVQLASLCGDESVARACLHLLPHEPRRPRTREEALVQEHAARAVVRWGNEQDRIAVRVWLERALASEQDPERQRSISRQLEDAAAPRAP
ncbi:MAG TPA: hypothetical protein VFY93_01145 [Planctomycetota bacterium]|nr:hypothetical protein [Planctomycetota bacterium]